MSSKIVRAVAAMAGGTALAQVITIIFTPLITRLFPPEAYGALGTFSSVLAVITPLIGMSYPIAIVMARDNVEVKALCFLSAALAILLAIFVFVGTLQFEEQIQFHLGLTDIPFLPYLFSISIIFVSATQIFRNLLIRGREFRSLAKVEVFSSLLNNVFRVFIGLLYPAAVALIGVYAFGYAIQSILYKIYAGLTGKLDFSRFLFPAKSILNSAIYYRDFALYRAPQGAINAVSQSLPVFALGMAFNQEAVGYYVLAKNILSAPLSLVGKSVSDVLYPRLTELVGTERELGRFLFKATLILFFVAALPFFTVMIFGREIFDFVFGAHWGEAGGYAGWLAIWLLFGFINRPAVSAIAPLKLQKFFLKYELTGISIKAGALFIGIFWLSDDYYAVALFSIAGAIVNAYLILHVMFVASGRFKT